MSRHRLKIVVVPAVGRPIRWREQPDGSLQVVTRVDREDGVIELRWAIVPPRERA